MHLLMIYALHLPDAPVLRRVENVRGASTTQGPMIATCSQSDLLAQPPPLLRAVYHVPCRSEGIIERFFTAAQELPIDSHPSLALCYATLILACSLHDAAALAHPAALAVLQRLLHVSLTVVSVSGAHKHVVEHPASSSVSSSMHDGCNDCQQPSH